MHIFIFHHLIKREERKHQKNSMTQSVQWWGSAVLALSLLCFRVTPAFETPPGPARSAQGPAPWRRSGHPSWLCARRRGRAAPCRASVSLAPRRWQGTGTAAGLLVYAGSRAVAGDAGTWEQWRPGCAAPGEMRAWISLPFDPVQHKTQPYGSL